MSDMRMVDGVMIEASLVRRREAMRVASETMRRYDARWSQVRKWALENGWKLADCPQHTVNPLAVDAWSEWMAKAERLAGALARPWTSREAYVYGRGDYGCECAIDLVEHVERANCSWGCTRSGTAEERAVLGPGGNCDLLARLGMGTEPMPEFDPLSNGLHCEARTSAGES